MTVIATKAILGPADAVGQSSVTMDPVFGIGQCRPGGRHLRSL